MNYQHKELAAGRWAKMNFIEQMANAGSEIERALNWKAKNNPQFSQMAAERAIELLCLTLANIKKPSHLKEVARLKETILDYFFGSNQYMSEESSLRRYFSNFAYAARRNF